MRIFQRKKNTRSSRELREQRGTVTAGATALSEDAGVVDDVIGDLSHLSRTEELPALREVPSASPPSFQPQVLQHSPPAEGDSDVFLVRRAGWSASSHDLPALSPETLAAAAAVAAEGVTLFVYGWENVQPGPLSWAFPSLRTALTAVRTMRNAIAWCIVSGREASVDAARAKGAILIEQSV